MDDFDVEAMLEAPFKADKPGEHEGPREEVAGLYDDLVVDRAQKRDDKKDERRERGGRSERERDRDRDRGDRDRDRRRSRSPPRRERESESERETGRGG
ncbi:hypothetical protein BDR26DRAFT_930707 [Obelidium mucronatum]|nr:hypothetical protein BDR26DRAFT_930707 [Obelidium mucronatum]